MRGALTFLLGTSLVVLIALHLVIVVRLVIARQLARAGIALVVPPLAPFYALEHGMRVAGLAWLVAFVTYAIIVVAF